MVTTTRTVEQRVIEVVREELSEVGTIRHTDRITEDLLADSLDQVELAMGIEEEFGIDLGDEEFGGWETVGDIIESVERHLGN